MFTHLAARISLPSSRATLIAAAKDPNRARSGRKTTTRVADRNRKKTNTNPSATSEPIHVNVIMLKGTVANQNFNLVFIFKAIFYTVPLKYTLTGLYYT